MRVAFITSRDLIDLYEDDRLALPLLAGLGIEVTPVEWGSEANSLMGFDLVVIRSPWDWYERGPEFESWLQSVANGDVRLANRACVRFLDKTYLRALEANGAVLVPTEWIAQSEAPRLHERMARRGWTQAVIKPTLSANASRTHRVSIDRTSEFEAVARNVLKTSGLMLQQYLDNVTSQGEWTFVFFANQFSHALRKIPKSGDFRVQADHGGSVVFEPNPSAELVQQAEKMLAATHELWLYARVDAIVHEGVLQLMELEVVEPELFLRAHPEAPARFADAISLQAKLAGSHFRLGRGVST